MKKDKQRHEQIKRIQSMRDCSEFGRSQIVRRHSDMGLMRKRMGSKVTVFRHTNVQTDADGECIDLTNEAAQIIWRGMRQRQRKYNCGRDYTGCPPKKFPFTSCFSFLTWEGCFQR